MIMNPVVQGAAEEKVYKITNNSVNFQFQESASPGDFVVSKNTALAGRIDIHTEEHRNWVPVYDTAGMREPTTRAPNPYKLFFVMPKDNVVIKDQ